MNTQIIKGKKLKLIALVLSDVIKFNADYLETDATGAMIDEDTLYQAKTDIALTEEMMNKFYGYDATGVATNIHLKNVSGATTSLDETEAPTAADFAALNVFTKSALKTVSDQTLVQFRTVLSIPSTTWVTLLRTPHLQRARSAIQTWL